MPSAAQRERAAEQIRTLCRAGLDPLTFRQELVGLLRRAVPFDGCALVTCDPETETAVSFQIEGADPAFVQAVIRNEYGEKDFNKFADLARSLWPVGILSEATEGKLDRSPRYRDVHRLQGNRDELRAACVVDSARWGSLTLDRLAGRPEFDSEDAAVVARLAGQIARALRRGILAASLQLGPDDERAGVILLDDANDVAPLDGRVAVVIESAHPTEVAPLVLEAHELSARERDVARLVLNGRSTKEIAILLELSTHTVQDHMKAIFRKTRVHSRGEFAARVLGATARSSAP